MEIENSFTVGAAPDRVYRFLLDINQVVGCVPGAQLSEVVDPTHFRGKVKIKVGPVTVSYDGVAHLVSQDDASRTAVLEAEGRETSGPGSARATTHMAVAPEGDGALVHFATEFNVVGRVAQFGRGIMEDVSRRLVAQMATCIRERLEAAVESPQPAAVAAASASGTPAGIELSGAPTTTTPRTPSTNGQASAPWSPEAAAAGMPAPAPPAEPAALDALALARGVAGDRLRRTPRGALAAGAVLLLVVVMLLRRRRRAR